MSLTNPNTPVSQQDLQDFYHKLLPYMGGSSTGGGHTIEDSEGTDLTQRDTLQFGEGFLAEDDDTNEKTVISPDVMQSGDMDDVITPLPSIAPKKEGIKYSTTEQVIGEWIDGKPIYQKTISCGALPNATYKKLEHGITNFNRCVSLKGYAHRTDGNDECFSIPTARIDSNQSVFIDIGATYININTNFNWQAITDESYITIQYTKTTD